MVRRITDLPASSIGPAAVGRLSGRPYSLVLETFKIVTQGGVTRTGDAALAFEGEPAIPAAGDAPARPAAHNGLEAMLELLSQWYSAPDQSTSQCAIDMFESHERQQGMSLLSYLLEFETRLDMARQLSGYSINNVALTSRLLKGAHLPHDRKDHVLWRVEGDFNRYEEVRQLLMQMAKLTVDTGLPGTEGYQQRNSYYTGDGDGYPEPEYGDDDWYYYGDDASYPEGDGIDAVYDAEGWPMYVDHGGNLCYFGDEMDDDPYAEEEEYSHDEYWLDDGEPATDSLFGKGKRKGKYKYKNSGSNLGSSSSDTTPSQEAHFGKGRGKGKGKFPFRKGKGKYPPPSFGRGKGKFGKGKAGRSLNMGCAGCGVPTTTPLPVRGHAGSPGLQHRFPTPPRTAPVPPAVATFPACAYLPFCILCPSILKG